MTIHEVELLRSGSPVMVRIGRGKPKFGKFVMATGFKDVVKVEIGKELWSVLACEIQLFIEWELDQQKARHKSIKENSMRRAEAGKKRHLERRREFWKRHALIIRHALAGGKWRTYPGIIPAGAFHSIVKAAVRWKALVKTIEEIV